MATILNRKEQIIAKLAAEGNSQTMTSAESILEREAINAQVDKVKKEFQRKERRSQIGASQLILTA